MSTTATAAGRPARLTGWLLAVVLAFSLAAVRCDVDVDLGVNPGVDAGAPDAGDGGAPG